MSRVDGDMIKALRWINDDKPQHLLEVLKQPFSMAFGECLYQRLVNPNPPTLTLSGRLILELIDGVRDYALNHYSENGWDFVVEAYNDEEILQESDSLGTVEGTVVRIGKIVSILNDRRKEVQSEAF